MITGASKVQIPTICIIALVVAGCTAPEEEAINEYFAAQEAITSGDTETALALLTKSIEEKPTAYALYDRAKLYADAGDAASAIADCEAGLAIEPEHDDLKWLLAECKKPPQQRFKGRNAKPPRSVK
jgi:lipoprotein NlpI